MLKTYKIHVLKLDDYENRNELNRYTMHIFAENELDKAISTYSDILIGAGIDRETVAELTEEIRSDLNDGTFSGGIRIVVDELYDYFGPAAFAFEEDIPVQ